MSWIRAVATRVIDRLERRDAPALVFFAMLVAALLYRALLTYRLFTEEPAPFFFVASPNTFLSGMRYMLWPLGMATGLAFIVWGVQRLTRKLQGRAFRYTGWALLFGFFGFYGAIGAGHHDLNFGMHVGLDYEMTVEMWSTGNMRDAWGYGTGFASFVALLPIGSLAFALLVPTRLDRVRAKFGFGLSLMCLAGYLPTPVLYVVDKDLSLPRWPLKADPFYYWASEMVGKVIQGEGEHEKLRAQLPPISPEPLAKAKPSLRLDMAPFVGPRGPALEAPDAGDTPWNVVVVVMESVGARYAFDTKVAGEVPMPFFKGLTEEGLFLKNHYSSSNTSPRSLFSIYTGLYPLPKLNMFCSRPDARVPGMGGYLGDDYDKFLVTPGRIQSYFPLQFMRSMGVNEMVGYAELPPTDRQSWTDSRNELDGMDFFLDRMKRAEEPFMATYYSYAPHYHYYDHGPEYRIVEGDEPLQKYYNNLRLLDVQMKRIYDQLEASGRMERTVLLFVGDHGEGFGQHPNNWTHSRQSYNENLRVPALFYQPQLFKPGVVQDSTTHPDLLPTLLDAIGLGQPEDRFQGDSLFKGLVRKYIFFYGNEDTISSVNRAGKKVQVIYKTDTCRAFDLAVDPKEDNPLGCEADREQLEAMLRYQRFQQRALPAYVGALEGTPAP